MSKSSSSRSKANARERLNLSDPSTELTFQWPLPPGEVAAIAVSGGADSFALLHWAWKAGHPIVALTVDHGLREGSAAEAQAVRTFCSERNIPHETLIWRGEKPKTGIQEAARNARYRLLCRTCDRMGIENLLTAHTADDQAETVFMRLRRGAGRGLAGMPRVRSIAAGPGEVIALHRPLLDVRRATLRAYAEEAKLPFVDDPSNDDDKYERVRVRALLAALEQQELLSFEALRDLAEHYAELTSSSDSSMRLVADRLSDHGWWNDMPNDDYMFGDFSSASDGAVTLSVSDINFMLTGLRDTDVVSILCETMHAFGSDTGVRLNQLPEKFPAAISSALIHRLGPRSKEPSSTLVTQRRTHEEWARGIDDEIDRADLFVVMREPAALLGRADGTPGFVPIPTEPGSNHLYDRRFIVSVPEDVAPETHLRPLGQLIPRDIVTSTLARERISTLPCLAIGNTLTHLPEQAVEAVTKALDGWKQCDSFLPSPMRTFPARSLLAERFAGDVIRF
ncbi:MAG: tRNA lysidine(34) synthetase TilS [Pseudomonadota bacterium]